MIVSPGVPDELRWFAESRFGMFVHFGLYSVLGRGEWVMYNENIPRAEYEKLAREFNPHRFDADAWVGLAREAGARYITLTAKHHDGFCLFDSELTEYKITRTPFGRDLVGEVIAACHRQGLRIVLYYSQPDWHHPNFVHLHGAYKDLDDPPATDRPDWPRYQEYLFGQVRELCTRYGRIDGIWFDGSHKAEEDWRGRELYTLIKTHQPHAVVNDRARCGDFFTPERTLPEDLTGYLFEACESVSPTNWGYQGDTALYGVPYLVRSLVKMAAAGGNYLLNVGPAPDGSIPEGQAERMRGVGEWLRRHGEAVYATEAGPLLPDANLRATRRGNTLFIHLLSWPDSDRLLLRGIPAGEVTAATLLGDGRCLTVCASGEDAEIRGLPALPPDAGVNVVALTLSRMPDALERRAPQPPPRPMLSVSATEPTALSPEAAGLEGLGVKGHRLRLRVDTAGTPRIVGWFVPEHTAVWRLSCATPGRYRVSVVIRTPEECEGAEVRVSVAGQELRAPVPAGTGPAPRRIALGTAALPAGECELALSPGALRWGYVFPQVEGVSLEPT